MAAGKGIELSFDAGTVKREGYDLVMGNRFRGGIKPGAMPWLHKYFGNPGLTALLNLFFRTGIGDSYCGMRGFSREMYDRLDVRSTGMEFAPELIIKASQLGARISEIPIYLWPDKRGRPPHLRSFRDGWQTLLFFCCTRRTGCFCCRDRYFSFLGWGWFSGCSRGRAT